MSGSTHQACVDRSNTMIDIQASLDKLRADAAEAFLIRDAATESAKRDLFDRLATRMASLAVEVERAIAKRFTNE